MGLIIKKDFNIGYDIECYMRISKLNYSVKDNTWLINTEYYLNKTSVDNKKILENLKVWIKENPIMINDQVWEYLNTNYFNNTMIDTYSLNSIGTDTLTLTALFSPWDFNNDTDLLTEIYGQIKNNLSLFKIKSITSDVIEDDSLLIQPIINKIQEIFNSTK